MAAERAAELSEKTVRVVPTRSMASGLAAAVALDPNADARHNAAAMEETLRHVRTGGVTEAARDDTKGRFRRGDSVGFIDEELVAWGEPGETLEVVLGELGREAELLTVIEGDGAPLGSDAVAALAPDTAEVELRAVASPPGGGWSPPSKGERRASRADSVRCVGRTAESSATQPSRPRGTTTTGHAARRMSLRDTPPSSTRRTGP